MLRKLLKKKDEFGVIGFLTSIKNIQKDVHKFQSKNVEMTLNDVARIIVDIKGLDKQIKSIREKINKSNIDDKEKKLRLSILNSKFDELKPLQKSVLKYEKQLNEYKKLGSKK